jgi:hypothetical protein
VVTGIDFVFACDCRPDANPVVDVVLAVTDVDTPLDQLVTTAVIMDCGHPGYRVTGTAFSTDCGAIIPGTFASGWDIEVTDPEGNRVAVGLDGPAPCETVHYTCHTETRSGEWDNITCAP